MRNADWMTKLPPHLRAMSIIYLAIPGSHNSMTYGISNQSEIAGDATKAMRYLYRVFPWFLRRWAKTQTATVGEQLRLGIRYFDLRVCLKEDEFYYTHAVISMDVATPLYYIREFLSKRSGETVILDFQHFYDMNIADHMRLQRMLIQIFGDMLYKPSDGPLLKCTLNYCTKYRKQVIIVYRYNSNALSKDFWPSKSVYTPWPNVCSIELLKEFLQHSLMSRPPTDGYVTQVVLTPDAKYIVLRICSGLKSTAKRVDRKMIPWISEQMPGPYTCRNPKVNILIGDFIEINCAAFCNTIIELNEKIPIDFATHVECPETRVSRIDHLDDSIFHDDF
ncbi:PI-PLC X domain-containing protein 3-like [Teleopsis dalmanni]|uniref:PI-PLC X domain-containing protein 3-like n=1 Tax=Teleopsis dalmanni TaxID=139649 RepID=UPI000D32BB1A|nr:PI-PLC X domain-containing protein 3-like [Teleopsis dalmanni]